MHHRPGTCQESEAAVEWCFTNSHIVAPAKRVKQLLNDVSPTPISYYMGVGETSFNSRFTLLAGARPMVQSFSHTIKCKNRLIKYQTKCINVNKTEVPRGLWYCPYCFLAIFPTIILMMMILFCSDWMCARLFFSIAWNQQQNLHPIWNQWQFWHPLCWYRSWLSVIYKFSSQW